MQKAAKLFMGIGFLAAGCNAFQQGSGGAASVFPTWGVVVPSSSEFTEHPPATMEERADKVIGLVENLVIAPRRGTDEYDFLGSSDLAVDAADRIYVLDRRQFRVQVFDSKGAYVRTLGRRGQGPGELAESYALTIAGDRVVVSDAGNKRLSAWTLDGSHLNDATVGFHRAPARMEGLADRSVIAAYVTRNAEQSDTPSGLVIARISSSAEVTRRYVTFPLRSVGLPRGSFGVQVPIREFFPRFAVSGAGEVYIAPSDEYEVLALTAGGQLDWALRVAWPRPRMKESEIERILKLVRRRAPQTRRTDVEWPDRLPALANIEVDGHGHVYVFPSPGANRGGLLLPVDVYSAEGERLFAGLIERNSWQYARGDHVYAFEYDESEDETKIVRYRIVEPF